MLVSKTKTSMCLKYYYTKKINLVCLKLYMCLCICDISVLFSQCIGLICFYMLPRRVVFFSVISVCVETGTPAVEIFTGALNCPHTLFLPLPFALALLNALTNS